MPTTLTRQGFTASGAAAAAAVAVKIRRARAATGAPTEPAAPMM